MGPSPFEHSPASPSMIERCLGQAFPGSQITLRDDSELHRGHPGRPADFSHLSLVIVADQFTGRTLLERHRMIYRALGSLTAWQVHALAITARAPDENHFPSDHPSLPSRLKEVFP